MSPLFSWGARKDEDTTSLRDPSARLGGRITETLSSSRALPKFLAALDGQPTPIILDLGPVVGTNVSFFGERLACKMLIGDVLRDLKITRDPEEESLGDALAARIAATAPEPVHGILCWDVFDYLDRPGAQALAAALCGLLVPRGVLHGFFGTTSTTIDYRSRFIVQSETSLKCRCEPAAPVARRAMQTGEITRLFPGLSVVESVLLQSRTRESLFRKA